MSGRGQPPAAPNGHTDQANQQSDVKTTQAAEGNLARQSVAYQQRKGLGNNKGEGRSVDPPGRCVPPRQYHVALRGSTGTCWRPCAAWHNANPRREGEGGTRLLGGESLALTPPPPTHSQSGLLSAMQLRFDVVSKCRASLEACK